MEVLLERPQAVVAGQPAALLHLHAPGREVELVVDDHDLARVLDAVAAHEQRAPTRPRAFMYVCGKARATRRPPMVTSAVRARSFEPLQGAAVAAGQLGHHLDAQVVAGAVELLARVAQTDDQDVGSVCRAAPAVARPNSAMAATRRRRPRRPRAFALALGAFALLALGLLLGHGGAGTGGHDDEGVGVERGA